MRAGRQLSAQRRAALLRQPHVARCCAACGYPVTANGIGWKCTICDYHFVAVPVASVSVTELGPSGTTHTKFSLSVDLDVPNDSPNLRAEAEAGLHGSRHGDL